MDDGDERHTLIRHTTRQFAGAKIRPVAVELDASERFPEDLYREMAETIQAHVLPALFRPYSATGWRERLYELLDRRVEVYEFIMPFRIAGEIRRFQSEYIANYAEQHLELERRSLEAVLPREKADDATLLHALLALSGFQAWCVLRLDLKLHVDARQ